MRNLVVNLTKTRIQAAVVDTKVTLLFQVVQNVFGNSDNYETLSYLFLVLFRRIIS